MLVRMFRARSDRKRIVTASVVAVVLGLLGSRLLVPSSPLGSALSRISYDGYYAWFGFGPEEPLAEGPVMVVYLDLDSFRAQGLPAAQPWPRQSHAQLLRRLTDAGARAVVFDILFDTAEPDSLADREFADAIPAAAPTNCRRSRFVFGVIVRSSPRISANGCPVVSLEPRAKQGGRG